MADNEYIETVERVANQMTPQQLQANLDRNEDLNETERSILREALHRKG